MPNSIFLGIGSNIGDADSHCQRAIGLLEEALLPLAPFLKSSLYKTEPVGYSNQEWFVNCAVGITTDLPLNQIFSATRAVERRFEKRSRERWGPREIDIDILFYNDRIEKEAHLIIPHPLLHTRRFVLVPLAEIAPHFIHPVFNMSISKLLENLNDSFPFYRTLPISINYE